MPVPDPDPADEEWDVYTDDIQSEDSEALHEKRPNRWKGARSTWREHTREERDLYDAMERERGTDLGVHLYDAFVLGGRRRWGGVGGLKGEDDDDPGKNWVPPRSWTAWPMPKDQVPTDSFMPMQPQDEDTHRTYRRRGKIYPRTALTEELSATVLRFAKERFQTREEQSVELDSSQDSDSSAESDEIGSGDGAEGRSAGESSPVTKIEESEGESEGMDLDVDAGGVLVGSVVETVSGRKRRREDTEMRPVVAVDDEASCKLLRPAVGNVVDRLERTLTVLSNMRVAGLGHLESSEEDSEAEEDLAGPSKKQKTQRPKREENLRQKSPNIKTESSPEPWQSPDSSEEDGSDASDVPSSSSQVKSSREMLQAKNKPKHKPGPSKESIQKREERLACYSLLGWPEVLTAASMAGFSDKVLARTAQRCADLFKAGIELHSLHEEPDRPVTTRKIVPGGRVSESGDDEDELKLMLEVRVARRDARIRRMKEMKEEEEEEEEKEENLPTITLHKEEDEDENMKITPRGRRAQSRDPQHPRSATPTPFRSRSRSSSRSWSVSGFSHCPHRTCPRAVEGFSRRANLQRHIDLVHNGEGGDGRDVDSEDEMLGGVHVDGFLRPIKMRKGWRAGDFDVPEGVRRENRGRPRGSGWRRRGDGEGESD